MQDRSTVKTSKAVRAKRKSQEFSGPAKQSTGQLTKRLRDHVTHETPIAALPASLKADGVIVGGALHGNTGSCRENNARSSTSAVSYKRSITANRKQVQRRSLRKVRFAPGPLTAPAGGPDGHPVAEGRVAKAVRILDGTFARGVTVSKKDVRELDMPELLGNEQYEHSMNKVSWA